jgi:hypothetical protein
LEKAKDAGHNPYVSIIGSKAYLDGSMVGCSLQQVKFVVGLDCCSTAEQHFGFKTLHSLKKKRHLLCYYCYGAEEEWGSKQGASSYEDDFIAFCRGRGLLPEMAWQVRLPWWEGRLDFYHFPSSTAIQIDGEGHFTGQWWEGRESIMQRDIRCCLQAMAADARIVRISHRDMGAANLALMLHEVISSSSSRFIVLSAAIAHAGWVEEGGRRWYADELLQGVQQQLRRRRRHHQQQQQQCNASLRWQGGCLWILW